MRFVSRSAICARRAATSSLCGIFSNARQACYHSGMRTRRYGRLFFAISASALLAGCAAGATPPMAVRSLTAPAAMQPDAKAQDLLYVSDLGANDVAVYTYPKGSLVSKLTGFGSVAGLCSNKAGDVFSMAPRMAEAYSTVAQQAVESSSN